MTNRSISIIGLGWLGSDLASHFVSAGFSVKGTNRTINNAPHLAQSVERFAFDIYKPIEPQLPKDFFEQRDLIINIAAGRRSLDKQAYIDAQKRLIDTAIASNVSRIIFVSTTSVFSNVKGTITNQTPTDSATQSGQAHIAIENYLLDKFKHRSCVLRLAGLVGQNPDGGYRHPIHTLINKQPLSDPKQPVNLIHKEDVIGALVSVIEKQITGVALNLCCLEHPTRQDFYNACARTIGEEELAFLNEEKSAQYREIDSKETIDLLDLQFKYPSPYKMPVNN